MKQATSTTERNYFTNPSYSGQRNGDYDLCEIIADKWEVLPEMQGDFNGNLAHSWVFDSKSGKIIQNPKEMDYSRHYSWGRAISSCLALYKLIQIFKAMPTDKDNDWYKVTWSFTLRHKASGEILSFGEFKAAFAFWTEFVNEPAAKKVFFSDIKELLLFMLSDKVPHTYDRVSAGSVA